MSKLTDRQKYLLALGLSRGEKVGNGKIKDAFLRYEDAVELYSNKDAAFSTLTTLRLLGYIQVTDVPGVFVIKRAPKDVILRSDNLRQESIVSTDVKEE